MVCRTDKHRFKYSAQCTCTLCIQCTMYNVRVGFLQLLLELLLLAMHYRVLATLHRERIRVRQMSCGHAHTLLLTERGGVLSCGSNEKGQCGQEISSTRPG